MTATLSFLVPVYDVQDYLDECLTSLVKAASLHDEIILVDDGSHDQSGQMCDAWAARFPDLIRVIHQTNAGLAATRNCAFAHSKNDYILFLDSDDVICPEAVSQVRRQLQSSLPDIITMDAILWREGANDKIISHSLPAHQSVSGETALEYAFKDDFLSSCCRVYRRTLLADSGPEIFPLGRYYEDNGAVPVLISKAASVIYIPTPLFRYRIRAGSITQRQSLERCLHQATSLANPLNSIPALRHNEMLCRLANLAALSHLVIAMRHAALIPKVSRQDFKLILNEGLSTLTLRETSLMNAVRHAGPEHARLRKHAMGMLGRPGLYLWTRWLMARWKQRRQMPIDAAISE